MKGVVVDSMADTPMLQSIRAADGLLNPVGEADRVAEAVRDIARARIFDLAHLESYPLVVADRAMAAGIATDLLTLPAPVVWVEYLDGDRVGLLLRQRGDAVGVDAIVIGTQPEIAGRPAWFPVGDMFPGEGPNFWFRQHDLSPIDPSQALFPCLGAIGCLAIINRKDGALATATTLH